MLAYLAIITRRFSLTLILLVGVLALAGSSAYAQDFDFGDDNTTTTKTPPKKATVTEEDVTTTEEVTTTEKAEPDEEAAVVEEVAVAVKTAADDQWDDLLHYIRIANAPAAMSNAQALLDNPDATAKQLYAMAIKKPGAMVTLSRGMKLPGLQEPCDALLKKIESGYRDWRSDTAEIERSIALMGQSLRGYAIGVKRLKESGEYAIPLLVQKLVSQETPQILKERIVTMLSQLGRNAVRAYSVGLQSKDLRLVEFLANALGQIQYPAALPRLRQALDRPDVQKSPSTVRILTTAIIRCNGGQRTALKRTAGELFYEWGEKYYNRAESLLPDTRYPNDEAFAWRIKEGVGLESVAVPQEILCDIYAMRMARVALQENPKLSAAVPLWLSACIRRSIDLPEGKTDPLWVATAPKAEFYTLASSPRYLQLVLARAMQDGNAAIAARVIEAMGKNTGSISLAKPLPGGAMPLVAAMGYPERNVRFLAAETFLNATPVKPFTGSSMVLSLMNEALRQEGKPYAMIIATDGPTRNQLKDSVRASDYVTIEETNLDQVLITAQKAKGLDMVIVGPNVDPAAVLRLLRREMIHYYLPVIITADTPATRTLAKKDGKVVSLSSKTLDEAAIAKALDQAMALSAGKPLTQDQAITWATRAANAIENAGQRDKTAFDLSRSIPALSAALTRDSAGLQIAAANALATINKIDAQKALIALALKSDTEQAVRVAAFKAASASVRRWGNLSDAVQAKQLVKVVTTLTDHALMQAAAELLGTMNLRSDQKPALILSTDPID